MISTSEASTFHFGRAPEGAKKKKNYQLNQKCDCQDGILRLTIVHLHEACKMPHLLTTKQHSRLSLHSCFQQTLKGDH